MYKYFKNSRRDFLKKLGGVAIAGITSAAFQSCSNPPKNPDNTTGLKYFKEKRGLNNEIFWSDVRSQFVLDPSIIQMNTSTEGSMPYCVVSNIYKNSDKFAEDPISSVINQEDFEIKQFKNCKRVSDFLGVAQDDIVLTTNTTEGMHIALNGLDFYKGDEIISTLHEHGSVTSPLHVLRDRKGVNIIELALPSPANNKQLIIDIFERAITTKTRALCFSHINYTTGLQMPVKELCDIAKNNGLISIVDGAHAVGMINFNLDELGCDFYASSGHKWLNGPPGTGIFYIRDAKNNPHGLWPVLTEIYPVKNSFPISRLLQLRGQQNTPALCAMIHALDFQDAIGKDKIQSRIYSLNSYLKEKVADLWGEGSLVSPKGENELCSGIAAFNPLKNFRDRYIRQKFAHISRTLRKKHRIDIRNINYRNQTSDTRDTFALRFSTHVFNNFNEIDKVLHLVNGIVKKM